MTGRLVLSQALLRFVLPDNWNRLSPAAIFPSRSTHDLQKKLYSLFAVRSCIAAHALVAARKPSAFPAARQKTPGNHIKK